MKYLLVFILLLAAGLASSQNLPTQIFPVKWKPVSGAGGYLAEVKNAQDALVATQQVPAEQTSLNLQLIPGSYLLRVTTLNRFLKAESDTGWVPFHVAARTAPVIGDGEALTLHPGESGILKLAVSGLTQDATAVLKSPSGKLIPVELKAPVDGLIPVNIPVLSERGDWSLVLTNPPKQAAAVMGKLSVHYPLPTADKVEPRMLQDNGSPQTIVITGKDFSQDVVVTLKTDQGTPISLEIKKKSAVELSLVVPAELVPGSYQVLVANDQDESASAAGTLIFRASVAALRNDDFMLIYPTVFGPSISFQNKDYGTGFGLNANIGDRLKTNPLAMQAVGSYGTKNLAGNVLFYPGVALTIFGWGIPLWMGANVVSGWGNEDLSQSVSLYNPPSNTKVTFDLKTFGYQLRYNGTLFDPHGSQILDTLSIDPDAKLHIDKYRKLSGYASFMGWSSFAYPIAGFVLGGIVGSGSVWAGTITIGLGLIGGGMGLVSWGASSLVGASAEAELVKGVKVYDQTH